MVVIDTNVVSELMRPSPAPAVMAWFSRQDSGDLYLTAVSEAELRAGAAILPSGQRRDRLAAEVDAVVREDFAGRVLPFDSAAARAYAAIAAIARARDAAVATRNAADFEHCGIAIINPRADDRASP